MNLRDALRLTRHAACTLEAAKQNWFSVTPAKEVHVIQLTLAQTQTLSALELRNPLSVSPGLNDEAYIIALLGPGKPTRRISYLPISLLAALRLDPRHVVNIHSTMFSGMMETLHNHDWLSYDWQAV